MAKPVFDLRHRSRNSSHALTVPSPDRSGCRISMWFRIGIGDPATQRGGLESLCGGLLAAPDRECGRAISSLPDRRQEVQRLARRNNSRRNAQSRVTVRSINEKIS
jgi:hypothetical protein